MDKIKEVTIYLLERGWYGQIDRQRSDETDLIKFGNLDISTFIIEMEVAKKTKEITKVSIAIYGFDRNRLDDVYNRVELEDFIENLNIVKKALDKLENELVKPMCEKFNLPFVNEESFRGRYGYLDVRELEGWLENEIWRSFTYIKRGEEN